MLSEIEELLWIASQENKTVPIQLIKFACEPNLPLSSMLKMNESNFYGVDKAIVSKFIKNIENILIYSCQKIFDQIQKEKITIVPYCDTYFPKGLRALEETKIPRLIYHQSKKIKIENGVAVVGTRNASTHAIEIARELGRISPKIIS